MSTKKEEAKAVVEAPKQIEFVISQEGLVEIQETLNAIISNKYQKQAIISVINTNITPKEIS
jgi:hypothetical protein